MEHDKYRYRLATNADVTRIHQLMNQAYEGLRDKSLFVVDGEDIIKSCVSDHGFIICADYEDQMIGFVMVLYPGITSKNYGTYINLEENKLAKVCHIESVVVDQSHRGNGLQVKLIALAEQDLISTPYVYSMATVSPKNVHSLNNFQALGYQVVGHQQLYGGLERHILLKEIKK
jgi:ribosomal protein S18 acetylase RimI-like enzyme